MGVGTSHALNHEVSTVKWAAPVARNMVNLEPMSVPLANPWAER